MSEPVDPNAAPVDDRPVLRIEPPVLDKEWMLRWLGYNIKRYSERIALRDETELIGERDRMIHAYRSLLSGAATLETVWRDDTGRTEAVSS